MRCRLCLCSGKLPLLTEALRGWLRVGTNSNRAVVMEKKRLQGDTQHASNLKDPGKTEINSFL